MQNDRPSGSEVDSAADRLADMFDWLGFTHGADSRKHKATMAALRNLTADIQGLLGETTVRHTEALAKAGGRLSIVAARAAIAREPQDFLFLQADIGRSIFEFTAVSARTWVDLTEKAHECCHKAFAEVASSSRADEPRDPKPKD